MNHYIAKDDKSNIMLDIQLTSNKFNEVMEARGCPVRVYAGSDPNAAMLAAWDWLALKIEKSL